MCSVFLEISFLFFRCCVFSSTTFFDLGSSISVSNSGRARKKHNGESIKLVVPLSGLPKKNVGTIILALVPIGHHSESGSPFARPPPRPPPRALPPTPRALPPMPARPPSVQSRLSTKICLIIHKKHTQTNFFLFGKVGGSNFCSSTFHYIALLYRCQHRL